MSSRFNNLFFRALRSELSQERKQRKNRISFIAFVQATWPLVDPNPLVWSPVHTGLCKHLEALYDGEFLTLIVNIAPGLGKSTICSVLFPAWGWAQDPTSKCLAISYKDDLIKRDTDRFRRLIKSSWYIENFGDIEGPLTNLSLLVNSKMGSRKTVTCPRGSVTGFHANMLIIDDPDKPFWDRAFKRMNFEFFTGTLPSRVQDPRARHLIVQQRIHSLDVSAIFEERDNVAIFRLPAVADGTSITREDIWKDDRAIGESIAPKQFPISYYETMKKTVGPVIFEAHYQQHPQKAEELAVFLNSYVSNYWYFNDVEGYYKEVWLEQVEEEEPEEELYREEYVPESSPERHVVKSPLGMPLKTIMSIDTALKKNTNGSFSSFVICTCFEDSNGLPNIVIRDAYSARANSVAFRKKVLEYLRMYKIDEIVCEDTSNGPSLMENLEEDHALGRSKLRKLPKLTMYHPGVKSKEIRAHLVLGPFDDGRVLFPEHLTQGLVDLRKELLSFPEEPNDLADALIQAVSFFGTAQNRVMLRAIDNYLNETERNSNSNILKAAEEYQGRALTSAELFGE